MVRGRRSKEGRGGGGGGGVRETRQVTVHLYRVYGAGSDPARVRVAVVPDLATALRERRVQLCLAL